MKQLIENILNNNNLCAKDFNNYFEKTCRNYKASKDHKVVLYAHGIDTPLGPMIAIADTRELYLLAFFDQRTLVRELQKLEKNTGALVIAGAPEIILNLKKELESYFMGELRKFKTRVRIFGTSFQNAAWEALLTIPYGKTRSYQEQAHAINKPVAHRAVANANACNQIAIIYPCHRVIKSDGSLGGYGGRIIRKKWLLNLEQGIKEPFVG